MHTRYAYAPHAGEFNFLISGRSLSQALAIVLATGFADGVRTRLDTSVCDVCDVDSDFIADRFEEILLKAVVEAEPFLEGTTAQEGAGILAERIFNASTTAFAKVTTAAHAYDQSTIYIYSCAVRCVRTFIHKTSLCLWLLRGYCCTYTVHACAVNVCARAFAVWVPAAVHMMHAAELL